ncbi:MAG: cyclic nucleotide-binding domain-containing protein [Rhodocyclaceae bacterium]|nr:cyclic nucleotide-binding domain-containing protein [Rhodocyclaceae bacterium]
MKSLLSELTAPEIALAKTRGTPCHYLAGEMIFKGGDTADAVYLIEAGQVSIFVEEFSTKQEIKILGPGDFFGEMALFNKDRRTASALAKTDVQLVSFPKNEFLEFFRTEGPVADKIRTLLSRRNEELVLKEKLIGDTGLDAQHLHVGIGGDPSMRETALFRERYESSVDRALPQLVMVFKELLLNRVAYRISIGFNNGEIRIATILDPFNDEFHPANRLTDETYIDRHFPKLDYERKAEMVRRVFATLQNEAFFGELPEYLGNIYRHHYETWKPMPKEEVIKTIDKFPDLRSIQNYYIRNATISITKDAIHMQFNCDGAHIVSAADYQIFLEENL